MNRSGSIMYRYLSVWNRRDKDCHTYNHISTYGENLIDLHAAATIDYNSRHHGSIRCIAFTVHYQKTSNAIEVSLLQMNHELQ